MKLNHNKKRNTAFIFEALVNELTKASIGNDNPARNSVVALLKEFYNKKAILKEELEIYNSFNNLEDLSKTTIEKILVEAKRRFSDLDRDAIFREQTKIINKINKKIGKHVWNNFVPNFRRLASINQILEQKESPKKQIIIENKLLENISSTSKSKNIFPKINKLTMKTFVDKFNDHYSETLDENQKIFLNKYITLSDNNELEFKLFIYETIDKTKNFLVENKGRFDDDVVLKIDKVLGRISEYKNKKLDKSTIFEILKIQSLVSELKNSGT